MKRGFTLVELLISLALMVMLMLGVNYIFSAVGTATGNANVLSKLGRDRQAASVVFADDFNRLASDGAFFLINSQVQPAFAHQKDQLGAKDIANPLIDEDGNAIPISTYNYRNHRTDVISFFARGAFPRRTGNDGVFVNELSSSEALLWYGHLRLADAAGTSWPRMGEGDKSSNPDNYYAAQWALGRVAMLLVEPDANGKVWDNNNVEQRYYDRNTGLSPLSQGSNLDVGATKINSSRYDLAGTSIGGYREILESFVTNAAAGTDWWSRMMLNDTDSTVTAVPNAERRYRASSFVRKPIDSASFASMAPIFLQACSSFAVEFAGDYFTQDPLTGNVTLMEPDGILDYAIALTTGVRSVRWYGMPRDISGPNGAPDGVIKGDGPSANMVDVVPLTDVMLNATPAITPPTVFVERKVPTHQANYAASSDLPTAFQYVAAWGPDVSTPLPILIRLIVTQDDAAGKIQDGVTSEYTFKLR